MAKRAINICFLLLFFLLGGCNATYKKKEVKRQQNLNTHSMLSFPSTDSFKREFPCIPYKAVNELCPKQLRPNQPLISLYIEPKMGYFIYLKIEKVDSLYLMTVKKADANLVNDYIFKSRLVSAYSEEKHILNSKAVNTLIKFIKDMKFYNGDESHGDYVELVYNVGVQKTCYGDFVTMSNDLRTVVQKIANLSGDGLFQAMVKLNLRSGKF